MTNEELQKRVRKLELILAYELRMKAVRNAGLEGEAAPLYADILAESSDADVRSHVEKSGIILRSRIPADTETLAEEEARGDFYWSDDLPDEAPK